MRFCSRSSLGCGMWFQSFQKLCTVLKLATWCVASEYAEDFSLDCMICSQMDHGNLSGRAFFSISSFSSELSVVNFKLELKLSLKLRYAVVDMAGWLAGCRAALPATHANYCCQ